MTKAEQVAELATVAMKKMARMSGNQTTQLKTMAMVRRFTKDVRELLGSDYKAPQKNPIPTTRKSKQKSPKSSQKSSLPSEDASPILEEQ